MSNPPLELEIKMLSDWHISSGTGRPGEVDRLVRKDRDGLPFIPAKTITGIWRDACELVALGLDENEDKDWHKWVDYLFGDQPALAREPREKLPRPAVLWVRAARLPESLRTALKGKTQLQAALTFIKPGISIDPCSGCAKPDFLRREEMARGGITFKTNYELNGLNADSKEYHTALALLAAGAALVERLGAKRRRGVGRCEMRLLNHSRTEALEWIQGNPPASISLENSQNPGEFTLPETSQKLSESTTDAAPSEEKDWYRLVLSLEAFSPLIIHKRTVGNVVETLDYIPGSCLLPIISKKLCRLGVNISQAIADGDILITHATIAIGDTPGRPVPFALFHEKLDKEKVYNRLNTTQQANQLKGYRRGYVGKWNDQFPPPAVIATHVETHNTVKDELQRPHEDVGGVYSYEAIPPETHFRAELRLRKCLHTVLNNKTPSWWRELKGEYGIGRTKKDDYGLVKLNVVKEPVSIPQSPPLKTNKLIVWLLSDVLLRDDWLRLTTNIDDFGKQLGEKLGVELTRCQPEEGVMSLLARQNRIDSWHSRWGLPRPSLVGLSAGTCIVFNINGEYPDTKTLTDVKAGGLGERLAEGYGQIAFDDPLLMTESFLLKDDSKSDSKSDENAVLVKSDDAMFDYARTIELEAWRSAIRRVALAAVTEENKRKEILGIEIDKDSNPLKSHPSLSQLGTLRSLIARLHTSDGVAGVTAWITHLKNSPNSNKKWESCLSQVEKLVTDYQEVWRWLPDIKSQDLTLTQGGNVAIKGDATHKGMIWAEAVQTLVDACIRAHKRAVEPPEDVTDG